MLNNMYNPMPQYQPNGINWVSGYEGARQYPVQRNGAVVLLDNEANKFYIKTCDNIGMCELRVFDFTEVTTNSKSNNVIAQNDYVTRDEFNKLIEQLGGLTDESVPTTK